MAQVGWSKRAEESLAGIFEGIGRDSPQAAVAMVTRIIAATRKLESFPRSGRVVPEFASPSIREVIVGSYRVVYLLRNDDVFVVAVRHAAMRFDLPEPQD